MTTKLTLTGITPSGTMHVGNYFGCIAPALAAQTQANHYMIADYHSLVKLWDANQRRQYVREVTAGWLACGLDSDKITVYRQSDIPEIVELTWILTSIAAKGLLNRAHAYKDKVATNLQEEQDADHAITMGLYCYPVLMAADILAFNAQYVPVGKDQIQHIEIARDVAARFNHVYQSEVFVLPEAVVDKKVQTIAGLDGRKMSKSYHNTIALFGTAKQLRKEVMKIITNSQAPDEPKDPSDCTIFSIYQSFASPEQVTQLRARYSQGIGWGEAKQILLEGLESILEQPRERYLELMAKPERIDKILAEGAEKARAISAPLLAKVKHVIGIR